MYGDGKLKRETYTGTFVLGTAGFQPRLPYSKTAAFCACSPPRPQPNSNDERQLQPRKATVLAPPSCHGHPTRATLTSPTPRHAAGSPDTAGGPASGQPQLVAVVFLALSCPALPPAPPAACPTCAGCPDRDGGGPALEAVQHGVLEGRRGPGGGELWPHVRRVGPRV